MGKRPFFYFIFIAGKETQCRRLKGQLETLQPSAFSLFNFR